MKKTVTAVALALLAFAGCRQKDVREFTIEVPALALEAHAAVERDVNEALAACVGVEMASVSVDSANRRVTLKYDSMQTAKKNIEMAVAQAGYTANGVTPESIGAKSKEK